MTVVDKNTNYALADEASIATAGEIEVLEESGKAVPFKTLYTDASNPETRHLIIFIRHYFCGHCEHYTQTLSEQLPPKRLEGLTPPVKLSIVGCGEVCNVADYKKRTNCAFPIYSDPGQKLYKHFGMAQILALGDKNPDYIKGSVPGVIFKSFITAVTSGSNMSKGGDFRQDGGELLFEGGKLKWMHRMLNTRDHAEVAELEKVLGI